MHRADPGAPRVVHLAVSAGGVPKHTIDAAEIGVTGLVGDRQRLRKIHGGPERAVCLYAIERIVALRAEGHAIEAGTTGENLTTEGLDWSTIVPGVRLAVGSDVVLEIASFCEPCKQIASSFVNGYVRRMGQDRHPGWSRVYARVLATGLVRVGDPIRMTPDPARA